MNPSHRQILRDHLATHSLQTAAPVNLSAGGSSPFYFDCKKSTFDGHFLTLLAEWIHDDILPLLPEPPTIVGGPTLGADFIAAAVILHAHRHRTAPAVAAIIRKEPKKHGTQNKIENEPATPSAILIVEDVITTGGSIARACDEFLSAGHRIAGIAALIDREAGGKQTLEQRYRVPVHTLFNRSDFPEARSPVVKV